MSEDNKQRLNEIKLSLYLNHIDKCKDRNKYNILVKILSSLVASIGKEQHDIFVRLFQKSIGDGLIGATKKELVYTQQKFFSAHQISHRFNRNPYWFTYNYKDIMNRDFVNETFLESLTPKFSSEEEKFVVNFLVSFIETFKFDLGKSDENLAHNDRTLEIEFYLLYEKMIQATQNALIVNKFIYNICTLLNIDYNSIAQLKNNLYLIDRTYPKFRYNRRYLMQEICTLYTKKGLTKGTIATRVLGKPSNFFYNNTNKEYGKVIDDKDMEWQYIPTIEWSNINKGAVIKFIDSLHQFIQYDI